MNYTRSYAPALRTFYVAGASTDYRTVRRRAADLERMGLEWKFDWTKTVDPMIGEAEFADAAMKDVKAAQECDLFVLLAQPHSRGAMFEAGVRYSLCLGADKYVHVVAPDRESQIFFSLPGVVCHASWDRFLVDVWNRVVPVGTPVVHTPFNANPRAVTTRAEATVYDGVASVWVGGVIGPVALLDVARAM